jgi:type IV pilus assembly protein PilO
MLAKSSEVSMSNSKSFNVDLNSVFEGAASQFRGLNPKEPGQWPIMPKLAMLIVVVAALVAAGWLLVISATHDELEAERAREPGLKQDYRSKLAQAVNLNELRKQKLQVEEYVNQLEKQLPGKAEMDALLSDINQAGLGRGLQFEFFRPGAFVLKNYYVELPIAIKVSGRYHDIGAFAADVANLSRIVTLHNIVIGTAPKESTGALTMEATARTYRYLDQTELQQVNEAAAKAKAGAQK